MRLAGQLWVVGAERIRSTRLCCGNAASSADSGWCQLSLARIRRGLKRLPHRHPQQVQQHLVRIVARRGHGLRQHRLRLAGEDGVRAGEEAERLFDIRKLRAARREAHVGKRTCLR